MKKLTILFFLSWIVLGAGVGNATMINTSANPGFPEAIMQMKAAAFIQLTVNDYERIVQHNLTFKEKVAFSSLKKNLKREIRRNPNTDLTVAGYLASGKKGISTLGWIAIVAGIILVTLITISVASDGWLL